MTLSPRSTIPDAVPTGQGVDHTRRVIGTSESVCRRRRSGVRHTASVGVNEEQPTQPAPVERPSLRRLIRYFLGLGAWGFGGPIATVGYMQRDLVERHGWLDRQDFLNGVALGQTMPGPLAAQVVMWVGFLDGGPAGALATSIAFILPSFALVLTVAFFYVRYEGLHVVQSLFYGIAPAVMAIIAIASVKLAQLTDRRDLRLWGITIVIFLVTALTGAEIALLFIAAGLLMILLDAPPAFLRRRGSGSAAAFGVPFSVLTGTAVGGTLISLGLFFLKAGAFIFGSGLAIVPFLREGVVVQHHWLTKPEFLDAVAMGLITPGPVVITAAFIGYLVGGLAGAGVATVAIFTPIYLGVVVPGTWFVKHQEHPKVRAFVKGATAAAAGAIAGATVVLTRSAVTDRPTVAILALSLAFAWRFKNKEPWLVLLAGITGLLLRGV
jgi:chromate transporter